MVNRNKYGQTRYPGELTGGPSNAFLNQGIIPSRESLRPKYDTGRNSPPYVVRKTLAECVAVIDEICK